MSDQSNKTEPVKTSQSTYELSKEKRTLEDDISTLTTKKKDIDSKISSVRGQIGTSRKLIEYNRNEIDKNNQCISDKGNIGELQTSLTKTREDMLKIVNEDRPEGFEYSTMQDFYNDNNAVNDLSYDSKIRRLTPLQQEESKLQSQIQAAESTDVDAIKSINQNLQGTIDQSAKIIQDNVTKQNDLVKEQEQLSSELENKKASLNQVTDQLNRTVEFQYSKLGNDYGFGTNNANKELGTSLKRLTANGNTDTSSLEAMPTINKTEGSDTKYFAKDMTGDGSDLAIVSVKQKDNPKKEEAEAKLKADGFKEVDENTVNTFKEKNAEAADKRKLETGTNTDTTGAAKSSDDTEGNESQQSLEGSYREPTYEEKTEKLKKDMKNYNKDDGGLLEVIPNHKVKYIKVNGSNKIKFPVYEKVMGLPPMVIAKSDKNNTSDLFDVNIATPDIPGLKEAKEYFLYSTDALLNESFPILIIHPLDIEYLYGVNGKIRSKTEHDKRKNKTDEYRGVRYNVINEVTYKFAVSTSNNIQYSHRNDYAPDSVENGILKTFEGFGGLARQANNMAQTTAGMTQNTYFKDLADWGIHAGGNLDEGLREIRETATAVASKNQEYAKLANTVNNSLGVTQSILGGGRIDFPDAWQDSKTDFQQQFSIELRTLNPDPDSNEYFEELLLPLYILLTLSLPTEGNLFTYKTPPLITCSLDDSFMEIKLGAITNISWSFDMKEINFKKVPYHCKVDLTVRDLYSVMSQLSYTANNEEYVEAHNSDITTKDEYIRRFVRTKDKKVPNEKYYLTEFAKIPAYLAALEKMQADEAKAAEDAKKGSTANGSGAVTKGDTGKINHDGTKAGAETGTAEKAAEIKTDPKTGKKSLVQSIGGFVTGITKNIKNVVADVKKAIQPVRQLINTGKTVLQTAYNLKTSIKMMGETANLTGILNGSFAASTRLAFDNLGKAGNVLSKLSGGALGPAMKSVGTICNTLSDIGRSALTLDLPSCVGKDGKTVSLKDQINVASSTVGATLGMVRNIANTVQAAKQIGAITKSSDPLATLNTYLGAANSIIDDIDFTDRLLNATKGSAIATGQYTAGQLSSDASLQAKFEYVAQRVAENARLVNSTMFNTTFMEYMVQQDWFDKYFTLLRTPTETYPVSIADFAYKTEKGKAITVKGVSDSGLSVSEATGLSQEELTKSMGHIDSALNKFADGVGKEFSANCKDITIQSASSGLANVADVPVTVVITSNLPNSNPTAGGTVTIG